MPKPNLTQLKQLAQELYGRRHLYDKCQIFIDSKATEQDLKLLRHEDGDNSGTWIDVSIYIPDPE